MRVADFIILAVMGAFVIYTILIYNSLVTIKHNVKKAWANIDVLLKQRHDELPKLVETCRQYMKFEQDTLEKVIKARSRVHDAREKQDMGALGMAETDLRRTLGQIFALAESYPELKTNESFQQLQGRITGLENAIADRREFYNESVNINNIRIEQFPDSIIAGLFAFKPRQLLEFAASETKDVDVKSLFGAPV